MNRPRIFHYDNRQRDLDRLRHTIIDVYEANWDLVSFLVTPENIDLLREKLSTDWWHFIIGDICLLDEDSDETHSNSLGLALAKQIDPTIPYLAWTAYVNVEYTRQLFTGVHPGRNILEKEKAESVATIESTISETLKSGPFALNFELDIQTEKVSFLGLVEAFETEMRLDEDTVLNRSQEIRDLFRRHFLHQTRIEIHPSSIDFPNTEFFEVVQFSPVGENAPILVQCGPRALIREMHTRWQQHAASFLDGLAVQDIRLVETLHYGMLAYRLSHAIDGFQPLSITGAKSPETTLRIIDELFTNILSRWNTSRCDPLEGSLHHLYLTELNLQNCGADLIRRLEAQLLASGHYLSANRRQNIGSRLQWTAKQSIPLSTAVEVIFGGADLFREVTADQIRLTHGSFTLQSVRVHNHGDIWLLPSARMGPGYYLRDLASLEAEIFLAGDAAAASADWLLALRAWLTPALPDDDIPVSRVAAQELNSRLKVVQKLRGHIARLGAQDLRTYYGALLLHASDRLLRARSQQPWLAMAVVLLADRLQHWENWPPAMIEQFRIVSENQVYVSWRDETVELPPREMALLRVLIAHSGEICSSEVCAQAWGEGGTATPDMLSGAINGIRDVIEPTKSLPWKYLKTIRGQGYQLLQDI